MKPVVLGRLLAALLPCVLAFTPLCLLAQSGQPLDPIVIEGAPGETADGAAGRVSNTTAGPVDGYRALTATSATKTNTPIEQIPQSIQVVPRELIEDQGAITVEEALRNVSGVLGNDKLSSPAFDTTTIRGFDAEQWLDGIAIFYAPGDRNSLVNIERIEVLKGPNALLYGGGAGAPPGGAVNAISKLPTDIAGGEFGITIGSNKEITPYFDVNQPLTKTGTVLFRMTGAYGYAESFIDVIETESYNLNPTLTFNNKTDTSLTLQGRFSRWEQPEYQGLPAVGTVAGDFRIDRDLFIGPSDIPDSYSEVRSFTATLDHRFNAIWSMNIKSRISESEFEEKVQTVFGADSFQANIPTGGSTWSLFNANLYQNLEEVTVNPNLLAEFAWGFTENKLLLGADWTRVTDDGFLNTEFVGTIDLTAPEFPFPYSDPTTGFDQANTYTTSGIYAQLQSTLWDKVHLVGGIRRARLEIESSSPIFGLNETSDDTEYLPRAGVLIDLLPGLSPYISYSESLRGNPGTFYADTPLPTKADQREAGVKLKLGGGLSGTLAVFEIERSQVPVSDGSGIFSIPEGEERSRGFEADLLWQPTPQWQVLASYAYIDAELTKDIPIPGGAPAGNKLNLVPEHSGRLWVAYKFDTPELKGWSIGAGVYLASEQFIDLDNRFKSDATVTFDAKIGYETEKYAVAFGVKNLADERYFIPYEYFGGRVQHAEERTFYGTFKVRY